MKLLAMSGFVPEQICDIIRFTQYTGERNISHYCGYASDYISQVIHDNEIAGAVYPRSCDSSRIISSYLGITGKFLYQIRVPVRQDGMAIDYFADIIKDYKEKIEKHFDIIIQDIEERTELVNQRNKELQEIYENIEAISYVKFLREIHKMLQTPLKKQQISLPPKRETHIDKRIFVVGSFMSNLDVAEMLEETGLAVVGDNLTESSRLFMAPPVLLTGNIYHNIAKNILQRRLSPTQDNFKKIIENDMKIIEEKKADGVIFITQKYCEPYDYLYAVYKKALDEKNIPNTKISLFNTEDLGKARLTIESFADIL